MSDFLTLGDVLGIHAILLQRYGGMDGVRDIRALESAIFRPQSGYYADVVEEAAALAESLLINHPFLDGNKRTAYAACAVFLKINGLKICASSQELHGTLLHWLKLPSSQRFECMVHDLRKLVR